MMSLKLRKGMSWTTLDNNGHTRVLAIETRVATQAVVRWDDSWGMWKGVRADEAFDPSAAYRVRSPHWAPGTYSQLSSFTR